MAEHTVTVTIRTDDEFKELQRRAGKQWRDETQQLNAEVERLLMPKAAPRAMSGTRRPRSTQQAA